jgi:proteasome lid subunit RPN8/RPN11
MPADHHHRYRHRTDFGNHPALIRFPAALLDAIAAAAGDAYPEECCGLIVGHGDARAGFRVTRVVASANVSTEDRTRNFEVDPQTRFDLMRELGELEPETGPVSTATERLIGHYHSHPDHPPLPSRRDREKAFETHLVWVIVGVEGGHVGQITAHLPTPDGTGFHQLPIRRSSRP